MSRRLASLVLGSFLLILGTFAPACPTCALPPASAPVSDPAPQDAFEAAAPGALLPEELDWLLALEGRRYELINGRLSDRKAADAAKHLLTNFAVWELLGRRASERTAVLRTAAKDGRLPEEFHDEAITLFWMRGTLISPEDRAFLREATRLKPKLQPGVGSFEDGLRNPVTPPPAGGSNPTADPTAQATELLRSLRHSLSIKPDADPRAAAAMNEALESLLKTPTGRELALEFTASDARATIEFDNVDNSTTVIKNGRRILYASGGYTIMGANPPRVVLNRHYLETDPDYRRVDMTATLGHELFGHAFEAQRSEKAGVPPDVIGYYRGDEAGAGLIGWLVETELGGPLDSEHMWSYLADPERYHNNLVTNLPYYATTLSLAEMRAPLATLEGRVDAIEIDRKKIRDYAVAVVAWRSAIEHFVTVHGMDRGQFSSLSEDIDATIIWNDAHQKNLDDISASLLATITHWKKPETAAALATLAEASDSTYMRQSEQRLAARTDRLRGLVAGRAWEPSIPPVPGKLTWDDLDRLMEQDRTETDHWEKTE